MYMRPDIPGFECGRSWSSTLDMDESGHLHATFGQNASLRMPRTIVRQCRGNVHRCSTE